MSKKLRVTGVTGVTEPEPGVVEITLELEDQTSNVLRMSLLTFLKLWGEIKHLASPADPLTDDTEPLADASA